MGMLPACNPSKGYEWLTDMQRLPGLRDMAMIVLTRKGSVFPRAFRFSLPCACLAVILKVFDTHSWLGSFAGLQIMTNAAAYSGFNLVLGFLFVFRTNMAYNRYWEGSTAGRRMFAEWFDTASTIMAFTKASKAPPEVTSDFVNQFVQYLSLLHGAAVATLRGDEFLDLITLDGLDDDSILELAGAVFPVTVIFQWIQQLLVSHLHSGVLNVPAPILSRAFQEFANGMVAFHDAQRVQTTSFPFPYVQMTTLLLLVHWCVTPIVICMWSDWVSWVFIFTLVQVFIFWCLYFTAFEIEFPFKRGHNTYAAEEAHEDFNLELQQLLLTKPAQLRCGGNETDTRLHVMVDLHKSGSSLLINEHATKVFSKQPESKSLEKTRVAEAKRRREQRVQWVREKVSRVSLRTTSRNSADSGVLDVLDLPPPGPQFWRQQSAVFAAQPGAAAVAASAVEEAAVDAPVAPRPGILAPRTPESREPLPPADASPTTPSAAAAAAAGTQQRLGPKAPRQQRCSPETVGAEAEERGASAGAAAAAVVANVPPGTSPRSSLRDDADALWSPSWPDGVLSVARADPVWLPRDSAPPPRELSRPVHEEGRALA